MIRLALQYTNKTWLGGVNVILNLINSVLSSKNLSSKIKIILFTNSKKISKFKIDKKVEIIKASSFLIGA